MHKWAIAIGYSLLIRGWADKFCLHLNRKWTGKDILIKKKRGICPHQLFSKQHNYFSAKSPNLQNLQRHLDEGDHLQSQAFRFVFCHSNLLAPILRLRTALPSVLLYSHQHTEHHKWLAFPAVKNSVTARCLNRTSENSSISMCSGWGQGEVRWKRDTMRLHRTGFIQMSNVLVNNKYCSGGKTYQPTYIAVM